MKFKAKFKTSANPVMYGILGLLIGLLLSVVWYCVEALIGGGIIFLVWNFVVVPLFSKTAITYWMSAGIALIISIVISILKSIFSK